MAHNGRAVLVVEDDPEINELVGAYVQIAGFEYQPALTGAQAVEKARQSRPVLIVLDIMLPDFDGFEGSAGTFCQNRIEASMSREIDETMLTAFVLGELSEEQAADVRERLTACSSPSS